MARKDNIGVNSGMRLSRRDSLKMGLLIPVGMIVPRLLRAQTSSTFNYYISTTGSDSNPGTEAQPWAITSLTPSSPNYGKVAGNTIGLLAGTYDVSRFAATAYSVKLLVPAGTSTSPTVIKAVVPQAAILVSNPATSGYVATAVIGNGANGVGQAQTPAYITISGLTIVGGTAVPATGTSAVTFAGNSPETCPGIVIEDCEIYGFINPNNSSNIGCIEFGTGPIGALVLNCRLHDCYTSGVARTTHGNSSGIHDYSNNVTVQYCTIYGCNNGIYQKNQNATPPPGGMQVLGSYFYQGAGMASALCGFNNAFGVSPPYAAQSFKNNVFENTAPYNNANDGVSYLQSPTVIANNTFLCTSSGNSANFGTWIGPLTGGPWGFVSWYNNICYYAAGVSADSEWGTVALGPSAGDWALVDYNAYPSNATFGLAANTTAPPSKFYSLTQWQALPGAPDKHSGTSNSMMQFESSGFVAGGGAGQYQLQSGSSYLGAGQGGANIGAWDGVIGQIGCNFTATSPAPKAPTLSIVGG